MSKIMSKMMSGLHSYFLNSAKPAQLEQLARIADARLLSGEAGQMIAGVCLPEQAGPGQLVWLKEADQLHRLAGRSGFAIITRPELADQITGAAAILVCDNPRAGFARIAACLYPETQPSGACHPSAAIDPSARIDTGADIGPHCVIGPGVVIARDCRIGAGCHIGGASQIGPGCHIGAGCVIEYTDIAGNVTIKPGSIIGGAGFGFEPTPDGPVMIPHLGGVKIGEDCHIGSGVTIDRGGLGDTILGNGVKIDNQVHIAHNVSVGDHTLIAGMTGIAGSATIGRRCLIGSQAGIADHVRIADDTVLLARSGVSKSLPEPGVYGGFPAQKASDYWKELASLRRLRTGRKGGRE